MSASIHVCPDAESLATHARDWLVDRIAEHHQRTDKNYVLALAGGSTPKRLYQLLGELPGGKVDWQRVVLVWGDERHVPDDHPDSNYRMVEESLLNQIEIPPGNLLPVPNPGGDPVTVAAGYERLLRETLPRNAAGHPQLNGVLLGMGDDVHTASLFPGTAALQETQRSVLENWVEKFNCWRFTLTAPVLNGADHVAFLISGEGKRQALQTLWHGERDPTRYPAQLIAPTPGELVTMVDRAAIGDLSPPTAAHFETI